MSMKTSSCKAKGRRAAQEAREVLLRHAAQYLQPDDIKVTSSSVTGEDLALSPLARAMFPLCFELKCQEKLNIWDAIEQAQSHCEGTAYEWAVVFRRNRSKLHAVVDFEFLAHLLFEAFRHCETRPPDETP
jgi:hypothetical protein